MTLLCASVDILIPTWIGRWGLGDDSGPATDWVVWPQVRLPLLDPKALWADGRTHYVQPKAATRHHCRLTPISRVVYVIVLVSVL
jgi:hypothetical protein